MKAILIALCTTLLCGCAGTKVLKQPVPRDAGAPLASACDTLVCVDLDWVVVRDGPGTWAAKANWDEYLLSVRNLSGDSVHITSVSVHDSAGHRTEPATNRADLVKGSKKAVKRYKDSDIKVEAGMGAGSMAATGGVLAAGGVGAAYAAAAAAPLGGAGGAVALGLGVAAVGPVLIVGGVVRGINNGKVNDEIVRRQSALPIDMTGHAQLGLDLFYPFAPSPTHVEIAYESGGTSRTLSVDTSSALAGMHITKTKPN